MGITTLDVVLPNPDKISEFKDPLLQWEKVDNARTPSWRRDLLLEEEPEEVSHCIPPPYEFSLMFAVQEFKFETPRMNELFLDKREDVETGLEDSDEVVLWIPGSS